MKNELLMLRHQLQHITENYAQELTDIKNRLSALWEKVDRQESSHFQEADKSQIFSVKKLDMIADILTAEINEYCSDIESRNKIILKLFEAMSVSFEEYPYQLCDFCKKYCDPHIMNDAPIQYKGKHICDSCFDDNFLIEFDTLPKFGLDFLRVDRSKEGRELADGDAGCFLLAGFGGDGDDHHTPSFLVVSKLCGLCLPVKPQVQHNRLCWGVGLVFDGDAKDGVAMKGDGRKFAHDVPPAIFLIGASENRKTPGAQNCRWTAGIFPTSRYCISPHPESMPVGYTSAKRIQVLTGHKKGHVSGLATASEGVLKLRAVTTPQISGIVKSFSFQFRAWTHALYS